MLRKIALHALDPFKRARVPVAEYECWTEPGTLMAKGNQVDICVIPSVPLSFHQARISELAYAAIQNQP